MIFQNKTIHKILAGIFIFIFVLSPILLTPRPAKAQLAVAEALGPLNLIQFTLTQLAAAGTWALAKLSEFNTWVTSFNTGSIVTKEYVLDGIANIIAKQLIRALTTQVVNWIKTGDFRGSAVVDNFLDNFMREMDNAAGLFLQRYFGANSRLLSLVCEPFRLTLPRLLIARRSGPSYEERARCKLSDIVNNVQNFQINLYFNDFSQGGWNAWFSSLDPSGNILGQYLVGVSEMDRRLDAAALNSQTEVNTTGGGLLSFQQCTKTPRQTRDEDGNLVATGEFWDNCKTQTPGGLVQDQLRSSETTWIRQLEVADEINEIINAFFTTMLNQLLSPTGGFTNRNADAINASAPATTATVQAPVQPRPPPPPPPPPPPASTIQGTFLGITGEDLVGALNQTTPNGSPDFHIRVSGLRPNPIRVNITNSPAGGVWETPFNGNNWIIATQFSAGGTGDFWIESAGNAPPSRVTVFYQDGTSDTSAILPPPLNSSTVTLACSGATPRANIIFIGSLFASSYDVTLNITNQATGANALSQVAVTNYIPATVANFVWAGGALNTTYTYVLNNPFLGVTVSTGTFTTPATCP